MMPWKSAGIFVEYTPTNSHAFSFVATPLIVTMATAAVSPRGSALRHPSRYSHPPPWQDANESSSTCHSTKNFFCVTLRLRVLGYIIQQPPSFLFVASLLIIATVIPFIGVYIENAPRLPDIDKMKVLKDNVCVGF